MAQINTSQDPDYFGLTGHEKKLHKTHFHVVRELKKSRNPSKWVRIGPGRYKLIPNVRNAQAGARRAGGRYAAQKGQVKKDDQQEH